MLHKRSKLWYCVLGNLAILTFVMVLVGVFQDSGSEYFRWGPNESLLLISVKLNTWSRWCLALVVISVVKVGDVFVNEIGSPILGFNIYDPDKTNITDFSKNELNVVANLMWSINSVKQVFLTVITVTQIDLALFSAIVSEIASIFTVRLLLN